MNIPIIGCAIAIALAGLQTVRLAEAEKDHATAEAAWSKERAAQADANTKAVQAARDTERANQKRKDDAIAEATQVAQRNAAAAAAARTERDGLRDQLAAARADVPRATHATIDQYATAAGELLDQCAARYSGLAEKADGHATDAGTLMRAWPR